MVNPTFIEGIHFSRRRLYRNSNAGRIIPYHAGFDGLRQNFVQYSMDLDDRKGSNAICPQMILQTLDLVRS